MDNLKCGEKMNQLFYLQENTTMAAQKSNLEQPLKYGKENGPRDYFSLKLLGLVKTRAHRRLLPLR